MVAVPVAVLLGVLVGIMVDAEPPAISLVSAPQWVRPGQAFQLDVAVSADINATTVWLEIPNVSVSEPVFNVTTSVIEFECKCSQAAADGTRSILARWSDLTGNPFEGSLGSIMVDGTAPTLTVRTGERSQVSGSYTWVSPATDIIVELTDTGSGPGEVRYGFGPGGLDLVFDPSDPFPFEGLAEGMHDLYLSGDDRAGNEIATPALLHVRLDARPPNLTRVLEPSAILTSQSVTLVGVNTVLTMTANEGLGGSGMGKVEYAMDNYVDPVEWRTYREPTTFLDDVSQETRGLRLMLRAYDAVGNMAYHEENLSISWEPPAIDLSNLLTDQLTNRSTLDVHGVLLGHIAKVHLIASAMHNNYKQEATLTVNETGAVDFELFLSEGPNYVRLMFEDWVGNTSPWETVVITLDTRNPTVASTSPTPGSRDAPAGALGVDIVFSEAINTTTLIPRVLVDGVRALPLEARWDIDWDNRLSLIWQGPVEPGTEVNVSLAFNDLAGNAGSYMYTFWTVGGTEQQVRTGDFLWGLFIGLVLGMVVAYLVTLRLRRGSSPRRPSGPRPLFDMSLRPAPSILAPDEERPDDSDMGTTPSGSTAMASIPSTGDDIPKGPPPSRDGEVPGQASPGPEEGVGQEGGREEEGGLGGDAGHVHDDEVDEELSADLDRLIEQATRPSSPTVTHEFPDGESVDVGTNEGSDGEHLPDLRMRP